ncbi:hypothetical protein Mgra_00005618 [Meloidogyne graminicola]|uniref:Uncharacterized protein n=1 Tax=Meloidogyne graminicola TaxID=189291 RepID=A0A8S9ZNM5_9BILA|nr:hypothetical protein Mgra_00005618 [Meloidogyne graminicola]
MQKIYIFLLKNPHNTCLQKFGIYHVKLYKMLPVLRFLQSTTHCQEKSRFQNKTSRQNGRNLLKKKELLAKRREAKKFGMRILKNGSLDMDIEEQLNQKITQKIGLLKFLIKQIHIKTILLKNRILKKKRQIKKNPKDFKILLEMKRILLNFLLLLCLVLRKLM